MLEERKTLAVIGAGPKGIAVAVKAKVLEEFGFPVDRVVLIEKNQVAANWSGDFGYTNGEMKLGTSPEKDVVFPVETDVGDDHLADRIQRRLLQFTWVSFLIQTRRYSDWIDRGRPAPCHQLWASYLQWVSAQLAPQVEILRAEVTGIDLCGDQSHWVLSLRGSDAGSLMADRLMLTGPGKTRAEFLEGDLPEGTFDLESFWWALKSQTFPRRGRMAIVGAGENSASVLLALAQYAPEVRAEVVSPKGFVSTRAESFYENQFFSQPERNHWTTLNLSDRMDFIERADLGVFSVHAMTILSEQLRHEVVPGRMIGLHRNGSQLSAEIEYGGVTRARAYDGVILATGFDQISMLRGVLSARARSAIEASIGSALDQRRMASLIGSDLSIKGFVPRLHLPMLAGLMQGPGFANLSCLGRLSDRVVADAFWAEKAQSAVHIEGAIV